MICTVCKSKKDVHRNSRYGSPLCGRHREQMRKYGEIRKRTKADGNDFVVKNGYVEIVIFDRYGIEKTRALADINDINKICRYQWCTDGNGYVNNFKVGTLHKFLLGKKPGLEIDHINRNKLDNRRSNLRIVTKSVNNRNVGGRNVYQRPSGNWYVSFSENNKQYTVGTYKNKKQADIIACKVRNALCEGKSIDQFLETL